jgi:hypothetical protein
MGKIREFWEKVFPPSETNQPEPKPEDDLDPDLTVLRYPAITGPSEELFLPVQYRRTEGSASLLGHELPGITYRVDITSTEPANLPNMPEGFRGLSYNMKSFQIGLTDGYQGISPTYNLEGLDQIVEVDKALSHPLRVYEKIAASEAKNVLLESRIQASETELAELEGQKKEMKQELDRLSTLREQQVTDELEYEKQQVQAWRNEQQEAKQEVHNAEAEREKEPEESNEKVTHNPFAKLITALLFLMGGLIFMIADVALSIAAIYALGFKDPQGGTWRDTVANPAAWITHWDGFFICLGIASITLVFKYIYERLVDTTDAIGPREKIILGITILGGIGTIGMLGYLRAEYIIGNQQVVGASPRVAFWSMFITTAFFPMAGAVLLSVGLKRTFESLGSMFRTVRKTTDRFISPDKKVTTPKQPPKLEVIGREITIIEEKLRVIDDKRKQLEQDLGNAKRERALISKLIPIWSEAIKVYDDRWRGIAYLERLLYIYGYEQGRILRGSQGAYSVISGILANELTQRSETARPELTASHLNEKFVALNHPKVTEAPPTDGGAPTKVAADQASNEPSAEDFAVLGIKTGEDPKALKNKWESFKTEKS